MLWLREKGYKAPSSVQRIQSSREAGPAKPQMSAPTRATPDRPSVSMPGMDARRSSHEASLSPSQWPPQAPEPGNVEREMTKDRACGRRWSSASAVTRASASPYRLCAS